MVKVLLPHCLSPTIPQQNKKKQTLQHCSQVWSSITRAMFPFRTWILGEVFNSSGASRKHHLCSERAAPGGLVPPVSKNFSPLPVGLGRFPVIESCHILIRLLIICLPPAERVATVTKTSCVAGADLRCFVLSPSREQLPRWSQGELSPSIQQQIGFLPPRILQSSGSTVNHSRKKQKKTLFSLAKKKTLDRDFLELGECLRTKGIPKAEVEVFDPNAESQWAPVVVLCFCAYSLAVSPTPFPFLSV